MRYWDKIFGRWGVRSEDGMKFGSSYHPIYATTSVHLFYANTSQINNWSFAKDRSGFEKTIAPGSVGWGVIPQETPPSILPARNG